MATASQIEEAKLSMVSHEGGYQLPVACLMLGLISREIDRHPDTIKLCRFDHAIIGKNIVVCDISGEPVVICDQDHGGLWKLYCVYGDILHAAILKIEQDSPKKAMRAERPAAAAAA